MLSLLELRRFLRSSFRSHGFGPEIAFARIVSPVQQLSLVRSFMIVLRAILLLLPGTAAYELSAMLKLS